LAEVVTGPKKQRAQDVAEAAYSSAIALATSLVPTHPLRLGVVLSWSVFCFEMLQRSEEAMGVATKAFNDAVPLLDDLSEDYQSTAMILQMLRDNVTCWYSDDNVDDDDVGSNVDDVSSAEPQTSLS